jgi:hypothetical protein
MPVEEVKVYSYGDFSGSCVKDESSVEAFFHGKILGIEPSLYTYESQIESDLYEEFCLSVD